MGQPRPRIMPVYIHAKVGIVDDAWATVGSANIDYASMDRAVEVNALLLNGVDGQPQSEAVDILRRKLWAEHLGFVDAQGAIHPNASELQRQSRPQGGWLSLWQERADATLQQLIAHPAQSTARMARVLPWPSDDKTHKEPRDYLTALGIRSHAVVPIKGTRPFDFKTGDWRPGSKVVMDYE
jgi:phosphatidylserine/phosphatidylglycerophosphate/cardiolipin synthase-like enzyme